MDKKMNKKIFALAICFSTVTLLSCEGQKGKSSVSLKTSADSVSYSIGASIGSNMKKDGLDSLNLDIMKEAIRSAIKGDSLLIDAMTSQSVIQNYLSEKQKQKGDANVAVGKKFLEENKSKPGVKVLPDGLQYMVIKEGTGAMPTANDTVSVHYHGTLIDGTVFDSSVERGEPAEFPVGAVIKGWTEALQMMKVGSKYKLFIPPDLAYGDRAAGPKIGANSTLIFEVELLSIKGK
jgi:FKBP-type peptidyl-prolyl cis-trans isomerase FklB